MISTHHYGYVEKLLAYIARWMPTTYQHEIITSYQDLYSINRNWEFKDRVFSAEQTIQHIDTLFKNLSEHLPHLTITITDQGIAYSLQYPNAENMSFTKGISNYSFVTLINQSSLPEQCNFWGELCSQSNLNFPYFSERPNVLPEVVDLQPGESIPSILVLQANQLEPSQTSGFLAIHYASSVRNHIRTITHLPVLLEDPITCEINTYSKDGELIPGKLKLVDRFGCLRYSQDLGEHPTLTLKPIIARDGMYRVETFYTPGNSSIQLPKGTISLSFQRGYEWHKEQWNGLVTSSRVIDLFSHKKIDMARIGWISSDTHNHWVENSWDINEDLELLSMVQKAEDIKVLNDLTLYQWLPRGPFIKPDHSPMGPIRNFCSNEYHIQMGEEHRNDHFYGHINLLGINQLIGPISTGRGSGGGLNSIDYPTNKWVIDETHKQGGIVCEAHGMGPNENSCAAVHAIMGVSDVMDQLDPHFYYKLLDIGIRIPLGNGSDHPARLVGDARCYVHVEGEFTYSKWLDGFRNKRSFVTSGPLVLFNLSKTDSEKNNVDTYTGPGSVTSLPSTSKITLNLSVWGNEPIGTVEIVTSEGMIIHHHDSNALFYETSIDVTVSSSTWFCARVGQDGCFSSIDTLEYDYKARPGIAHTSALYVDVPDTTCENPKAVTFWLERIVNLRERFYNEGIFANHSQREEAMEIIDQCIEKLKGMKTRATLA